MEAVCYARIHRDLSFDRQKMLVKGKKLVEPDLRGNAATNTDRRKVLAATALAA